MEIMKMAEEEAQHEQDDTEEPPAAAAAAAAHPMPPYDQSSDIKKGLQCYYEGCTHKSYEWGKLINHVKNHHKMKLSQLKGTHLHTMGTQDLMLYQANRRKTAKDSKKKVQEDQVPQQQETKKVRKREASCISAHS